METGETVANLGPGGPFLLGRDRDVRVRLDNPFVSRRHLELSNREGFWVVQSLEPTNPSTLNGQVLSLMPAALRHGDELRVGHLALGVFAGPGGTEDDGEDLGSEAVTKSLSADELRAAPPTLQDASAEVELTPGPVGPRQHQGAAASDAARPPAQPARA
jgi:pSer/pThr/pTyr-binding forkhead associated (FHA) protein